jgi:hypothetical protein
MSNSLSEMMKLAEKQNADVVVSYTTGKTELYVGHNNFRRFEGKPTEIT